MNDTDYKAIIATTVARLGKTIKQREELDNQAAKLRQFLMATINMLPDDERAEFLSLFETLAKGRQASEEGLKDACLRVLRESNRWLTATQVRDWLLSNGFNFDAYQSNPLASVSTTLRRMKEDEVDTSEVDGVAAYRINQRIAKANAIRRSLYKGTLSEKIGQLKDMK